MTRAGLDVHTDRVDEISGPTPCCFHRVETVRQGVPAPACWRHKGWRERMELMPPSNNRRRGHTPSRFRQTLLAVHLKKRRRGLIGYLPDTIADCPRIAGIFRAAHTMRNAADALEQSRPTDRECSRNQAR